MREGLLLVAAGSLHGHKFRPLLTAEVGQRGDTFCAVGERPCGAFPANARFQRILTDIHSTNDPRHGNLPCMCDRSHATVRSCVTWAAVPGLSDGEQSPQDEREPSARGGTDASVPPLRHSL